MDPDFHRDGKLYLPVDSLQCTEAGGKREGDFVADYINPSLTLPLRRGEDDVTTPSSFPVWLSGLGDDFSDDSLIVRRE